MFRNFGSPEPNVKCDVSESNWPGVRVCKHGDDAIKSDNSKSKNVSEMINHIEFQHF